MHTRYETGEWDMGLAVETGRPASNASNISNISNVSNSSNVEPTHRNTGSVSQLDHTEVFFVIWGGYD